MTEEERMREVERISRRTKESVKIPPDQQRTIRIVRFRNKTLASYVGTMEEALKFSALKWAIRLRSIQDIQKIKKQNLSGS